MNQQQQQLRHQKEQGWAYLDRQRKLEGERRRLHKIGDEHGDAQYLGMGRTSYVLKRRSVLGSFLKGLFITLLTLTILAAIAFGAFVILNRLDVFN